MRLWSVHPKYLDPQGLVALWRETLLAQKVLAGKTKGYRNHPQLLRFKEQNDALKFIGTYLSHVCREAEARGYCFDRSKIHRQFSETSGQRIAVTTDQRNYEFQHLKKKLATRSPLFFAKVKDLKRIQLHPLFYSVPGKIETWEIIK